MKNLNTYMLERLLKAFSNAGFQNPCLEYDHGDNHFDIGVTLSDGVYDQFHVEVVDDKIVWYDFTHTTELGPIDGSEIIARLEA